MSSIEVGDRFESKDSRDRGRVVEVTEARGLDAIGASIVRDAEHRYAGRTETSWGQPVDKYIEWLRAGETYFTVRTEVSPNNPAAVGHTSKISERTLRSRYRKVSH